MTEKEEKEASPVNPRKLWNRAGTLMGARIREYAKWGWFDRAGLPRCCAVRIVDECAVFIVGPVESANKIGKKIGFTKIKIKDKPFWKRQEDTP